MLLIALVSLIVLFVIVIVAYSLGVKNQSKITKEEQETVAKLTHEKENLQANLEAAQKELQSLKQRVKDLKSSNKNGSDPTRIIDTILSFFETPRNAQVEVQMTATDRLYDLQSELNDERKALQVKYDKLQQDNKDLIVGITQLATLYSVAQDQAATQKLPRIAQEIVVNCRQRPIQISGR